MFDPQIAAGGVFGHYGLGMRTGSLRGVGYPDAYRTRSAHEILNQIEVDGPMDLDVAVLRAFHVVRVEEHGLAVARSNEAAGAPV